MLKKFKNLKHNHQLIFSLIIISGVTGVWRGIWGLLDVFFIPGDLTLSYSLSLILGIVIITITHYTIDRIV
ncbi:MAG: hypothetical protein WCT24_00590 [Patescibacteria group bacterium]|jgi:hypothetical protein